MRIKPFKIACLTVSMVALLSALCLAAESTALSDAVQAQIEAQAKEMNAAGVPAEPARNMLTMMHQHQFTHENIVKAQNTVMSCANNELPTEPVMSKAMGGMAKNASQQQVIAAMQTVQNRYASSSSMAKTMSKDKATVATLTHAIADSMAAGMKSGDMEVIALQVKNQNRTQAKNKNDENQLAIQTMQTTRTMARLGLASAQVSDTICQALQNQYTHKEMEQLRHQMANQVHQQTPQQIANQYASAIGKGGSHGGENQGGHGSGDGGLGGKGPGDGGAGGSSGGSGGNGSGSDGNGGGSSGSGSGSGSGGGGNGGGSGSSGSGGVSR